MDPVNFSHIQSATTAKQVWDNLTKAFDDSGLSRRGGLLRQLISTRLDDCKSMEDYVNRIVTTAHKLRNEMDINDEWIGTLLSAGLNDDFKPMIMAIESSDTPITSDFVKTKLLQDFQPEGAHDGEKAMHIKRNNKKKGKRIFKCYECNEEGHFAKDCPTKGKRKEKDGVSFTCLAVG